MKKKEIIKELTPFRPYTTIIKSSMDKKIQRILNKQKLSEIELHLNQKMAAYGKRVLLKSLQHSL